MVIDIYEGKRGIRLQTKNRSNQSNSIILNLLDHLIFQNMINFLINLGLLKEELNKIGFVHNY